MPIKSPFYPLLLVTSLMLSISSCQKRESALQYSPMQVERLDFAFADGSHVPGSQTDTAAIDLYLAVLGADTIDRSAAISAVRDSRMMKVFGADVNMRLGSLDSIEVILGNIKSQLENGQLPNARLAKVYGIITPYRQSVIVSDSIVFVSLNHYLGKDYPGYEGLPQYQRESKIKSRIPRDVAEAIVRINYPYIPINGSLIERMLYEGAVIEATSCLTDLPYYSSMGLTKEQYSLLCNNEAEMWQYLAANDMLYSTVQSDISRLVDPAPYTIFFRVQVPGQAGSYIGNKIIKQYLERNSNIPISHMLQPNFYSQVQEILISSGYSPIKH